MLIVPRKNGSIFLDAELQCFVIENYGLVLGYHNVSVILSHDLGCSVSIARIRDHFLPTGNAKGIGVRLASLDEVMAAMPDVRVRSEDKKRTARPNTVYLKFKSQKKKIEVDSPSLTITSLWLSRTVSQVSAIATSAPGYRSYLPLNVVGIKLREHGWEPPRGWMTKTNSGQSKPMFSTKFHRNGAVDFLPLQKKFTFNDFSEAPRELVAISE